MKIAATPGASARNDRAGFHAGVWIAVSALLTAVPGAAAAVSPAATIGCDYYSGAGNHLSRGAMAAFGLGIGSRTQTIVAAGLFDDSVSGDGTSLSAGAIVRLHGALHLQALGSHLRAAAGLRAWRYEIGPKFRFPQGRNLTVLFSRYDDAAVLSNGVRTEVEAPVGMRVTARATGSCANRSHGGAMVEGSAGLVWNVTKHLELAGDIGLTQNGGGAPGRPVPVVRGLDGLPILGGTPGETPSAAPAADRLSPTFLVGVRLHFP